MKIQKVIGVKTAIDSDYVQEHLEKVNEHLKQGWRVKEITSIALPAGEGYRSRALSYFILEKSSNDEK